MRSVLRVGITLSLVVVAILAGTWLWQYYLYSPWTRDARIRADVVTIAPDLSGWVRELKVHDNQQVAAGELLMSLDRERYQAALEQARPWLRRGVNNCDCVSTKRCGVIAWGRRRSAPSCVKTLRSTPRSPVVNISRHRPR